jgi:hypothetical protein
MRPLRPSNSPLRRLAVTGVAFLAVLLSCGRDVTGPNARGRSISTANGLHASLSVVPQFPEILSQTTGGGGTVPFNRVHVVLRRVDLSLAFQTTVEFPASATTVPLVLDVQLLASTTASGESMTLTLEYLNSDNTIVFTGGPTTIIVVPTVLNSPPPPPVDIPVKYTGPGANAAKVSIAPKSLALPSGTAFTFTAQAFDANNAVLTGTPIVFTSLDPTLATVTVTGTGTAIGARGTARIVAQSLTGQTDIATLTIQPVPSAIAAVSGGGQTNSAGATLAQPLIVKVTAGDGLAVAGASVAFTATTGGGTVTNTATTDANGNAQATWKLGTTVGTQSVTANGGTAGQVVFTATATAATPTKLVVTSAPTSGRATNALADFVVSVQDVNSNVVTAFTGPVTVLLGGGTAGATLTGTTTVTAVNGVATFTALGIGKAGTAYSLTASASGLSSATSAPFDIIAGTANKLSFTGQPTDAVAGASVGTLTLAVQDAAGNPITTFTGPVTLGLALNPGTAAISGTTTVNAVAGVATFTGISLNRPGIGYSFVASASGLTGANSTTFSISVGPASQLTLVSGGAQTAAASATLALPIVLQVTDASGNTIVGKVLTFAIATGGGSVTPTTVNTGAGGLATVSWTLGSLLGAQTLTVSGVGLSQSPLTVTATAGSAGAATQLVITTQPSNVVSGASIAPAIVVTAKDAGNNVATTFTGNVALTFGANPGGAALGGTVTVAAVAGVATFAAVSLDKVGIGYTLVAGSAGLTSATTSTFNVSAGAAAIMTIITGNAQTGLTSSALGTPLQVKVTDTALNPVSGYTVNWSVASGGGSIAATAITGATGLAQNTWTLGPVLGPQSVLATATGLAGSPATFTATATSSLANKSWNGSTSTAWNTAGNWTPVGVPVATDSVLIPVSAFNPVLPSGTTMIKALYVNSGASLTLSTSTLVINGNVVATGPLGGTGTIALASSTAATVSGSFNGALTVTGPYSANASITTQGLIITGTTGSFDANGQVIAINGALQTLGSGTLKMTVGGSALNVTGGATFGGGSETGLLTAGVLSIAGNFTEGGGATDAFIATLAHSTVFNGSVAQTLSFAHAGPSGFGTLIVNNAAGVTMLSNFLTQNVTMSTGALSGATFAASIFGTLTDPAGLLQVAGISFGASTNPVSATTSTITLIGAGSVTFNNNPSILAGNLTITGPANVLGNLVLNGHSMTVNGSFATSTNGQLTMSGAEVLNVTGNMTFGSTGAGGPMSGGTLNVGGNFVQSGNVQALSAFGTHTTVLNGSGAQTVSFASVDSTFVPGCAASCFANFAINKATGSVSFSSPVKIIGNYANTSTIPVTTLTSNSEFIVVGSATFGQNGAYHNLGLASSTYTKGLGTVIDTVVYFGTGQAYAPVLGENHSEIRGTANWTSPGTLTGNLLVSASGQLNVSTAGAVVTGNFKTTSAGTLRMITSTTDSLRVNGNATFSGGNTSGLLSSGTLLIGGNFTQSGNAQSYSAATTHVTRFTGAPSISFVNPTTSQFGRVEFGGAGSPSVSTDFRAAGDVWLKTAGPTIISSGQTVTIAGSLYDSTGGRWNVTNTTMSGTNPNVPKLLANNLTFAGSAALMDSLNVGGALSVSGGGAMLAVNGHTVRAGTFNTSLGGVLKMNFTVDSLIVASNAIFNGGSTTGLLTAGTLVIRSNMTATGSAFDASGSHTTVFNSQSPQTLLWNSAVANIGYNNMVFDSLGTKSFSGNQFIKGTVQLKPGSGVVNGSYDIGFYGSGISDLTAASPSKWQPGVFTIRGAPTVLPVNLSAINTIHLLGGTTVALSTNLSANYVTVDSNSTLNLNGHFLNLNGNYFTTQNGGVLQMTTVGDSLETNQAYFNGGATAGLLTKGGIAIVGSVFGTLYQGYDAAGNPVANASATSFSSSGTRTWLNPPFQTAVAFKNPGSGAAASHFSFVKAMSSNPVRLKTNVFVDSMLTGEVSGATWQSDSAAQGIVRTVTTNGIYNSGTFGLTMQGVNVVLNDGPGSSTYFNSVTWQSFPGSYSGVLFTSNRFAFAGPTVNFNNYSGVTFGATGQFVKNTGTLSLLMGLSNTPANCVVTLLGGQSCK